jgi:UDP-N-acetylmuramoyl-L-alanyl-D-glutamate--2,6-diaminopimelate ligase
MRLSELVAGFSVEVNSGVDPEVRGIAHDSRRVERGDLFVALIGARHDGRVFAPEAVRRGAVAVLAEGAAPEGIQVPWLSALRPRDLMGPLAGRLYGHPDEELLTVGVTGTNGKSTVVALVGSMLEAAGRPTGVLGTLGYRLGRQSFPGDRTTPEASDLFRTLREMRRQGAEAVAMEVSSHALALGRLVGAAFDVAVFTNLTRDHFDFHADFESYFQAKKALFTQLKPGGRVVVNVADAYGRRLIGEFGKALTFGENGEVRAKEVELHPGGIRGVLITPRGELTFETGLLGRYNLENVVAAVAVAEALELPHPAVVEALASQRPLPGRLESVDIGQPFPVFVDYAHTDAALEAVLRAVREFSQRQVILVFGCGGDRDRGKRVLMGRAAGELAELPIITSDNPRGEDPLTIISAVEEGLKMSGNDRYRVVPDRREAIRRAVAVANPDSVVVVSGKGHETVQIVGDRELPFSDREEVEQALEERFGSTTGR